MCNNTSVTRCNTIIENCAGNKVDKVYDDFMSLVKHNMFKTLPVKRVATNNSNITHRNKSKPWWSDELTVLWNSRCEYEQLYCNSSYETRTVHRQLFINEQKKFDNAVKRAKMLYWHEQQQELLQINQSSDFWKKFGKVGVGHNRNNSIPWEIVLDDSTISVNQQEVLAHWREAFKKLLNPDGGAIEISEYTGLGRISFDTSSLDAEITSAEIHFAVHRAKKGKAIGFDEIPMEVLQNDQCMNVLLTLFNKCFNSGRIPEIWSCGIINPVIKDGKKDHRDPNNYRGITITSAAYKLYCSIINNRLYNWFELNNGLCDEQGGFRSGRCTGDHISSLGYIIETRNKKKQDTYAAFIDFSKAYDRINRSLLWHKLSMLGVSNKMLNSLKSLYQNVQCTVRINGICSEWFQVETGLKQGCILSPLLFNGFVNDLVQELNALECGIKFNDISMLSVLLYADDIVILSDDDIRLQTMLNSLNSWCIRWGLVINVEKSKIVHFRSPSITRSDFNLPCGDANIETVCRYKYLGVILTEHLDFTIMTKTVAQSASRALGLLIAKDKIFGGMPFQCFHKCYESLVQSVIDYSSAVWGTRSYSWIDAVQNRACRYFLGLGKYAPNQAINGDMGWKQPEHRQWLAVARKFCRMIHMDDALLTKQIFSGCMAQANSSSCKTWFHRATTFLSKIEHEQICRNRGLSIQAVLHSVDTQLHDLYEQKWQTKLNTDIAVREPEAGGNKLRTYRKFKQHYRTEPYVNIIIAKKHRSAYAKFRCGVAPIKIETCRYGLNRLPVEQRVCEECQVVEDECHVIMHCTLYTDIRDQLFIEICDITSHFQTLTPDHQFLMIMSDPQYYRCASRAMCNILNRRRCTMLQ